MLVPQQPHFQQVCQRCGRLPAYRTAVCPLCGAQLALPWPSQNYGPYPTAPFPPFALAPQANYTPLIVEMFLNLIGLYGVGWLMLGNLAGGIVLLVVSLVLWPVVALVGIFTMGLGVICLWPVAIVALIINLVVLQQAIKRKAC